MPEMTLEGRFAADGLLQSLGSRTAGPFFVYNARGVRESCARLHTAFSEYPAFSALFPVRMNPNPQILRLLQENGCGALCASEAELLLALRSGFAGKEIVYAPFLSSPRADALVCEIGALRVLDAPSALPERLPERVLLRCRAETGDARTLPGKSGGKSGMTQPELRALIPVCQARGAEEFGLSFAAADCAFDTDALVTAVRLLLRMVKNLSTRTGKGFFALAVSGGIPPVCDELSQLARLLLQLRHEFPRAPDRLMLAPGRFLMEQNGILVGHVLAVKELARTSLLTDLSAAQLLRPMLVASRHRVYAPGKTASRGQFLCDIYGTFPTGADRLAQRCPLPELSAGDLIVLEQTGADAASLSSAYAGALPCAEYLLCADGSVQKIAGAWDAERWLSVFAQDCCEQVLPPQKP